MSDPQPADIGVNINFCVAILDPGRTWGQVTQAYLQERLCGLPDHPSVASAPPPCLWFSDAEHLYNMLEIHPFTVPVVQIADTAARMPTPEQGSFCHLRGKVPRCRNILYTASEDLHEHWKLMQCTMFEPVRRTHRDAVEQLLQKVTLALKELYVSAEYRIVCWFARNTRTGKSFTMSAMSGDEAGHFSPRQMLLEMARGTPRGHEFIASMLPERVLERRHER